MATSDLSETLKHVSQVPQSKCITRTQKLPIGLRSYLSPEGRLMRFPSFSLSRERLNLPFLFFTLGLSLLSWKMRMFSSRSSTSISRSASCCSRRFNSSSCDFCCRAARVSSSSLERSSWKKRGHRNNSIGVFSGSEHQKHSAGEMSPGSTQIFIC